MKWYLEPWKKYAVFEGRARRTELITFGVINLLVYALLYIGFLICDSHLGHPLDTIGVVDYTAQDRVFTTLEWACMIALVALWLAAFIPMLACGVRRLHDSGKSGWLYLIALIPFIGGLILFVLLLLNGDPGENRFGRNPRDGGEPAG